MANNLKSFVTVIANEEATKWLDQTVEKIETGDILSFAQGFYENVDVSEDGTSVMNAWSLDNLGSKWTYLYDVQADNQFSIESAWYAPTDFFKHLYKMVHKIDPEAILEVTYEDETYDPIGALVIKKNDEGEYVMYSEEDNDMEDPTDDMDWDDEGYDEVQMEFMDSIYDRTQELLKECYVMIEENDGERIFDEEVEQA